MWLVLITGHELSITGQNDKPNTSTKYTISSHFTPLVVSFSLLITDKELRLSSSFAALDFFGALDDDFESHIVSESYFLDRFVRRSPCPFVEPGSAVFE